MPVTTASPSSSLPNTIISSFSKMATAVISKAASRLSTRLHSKLSTPPPLLKPSSSPRPLSRLARLPVELGCVASMLPLHSAVASSTMVSSLACGSHSWALVPQGISMPL